MEDAKESYIVFTYKGYLEAYPTYGFSESVVRNWIPAESRYFVTEATSKNQARKQGYSLWVGDNQYNKIDWYSRPAPQSLYRYLILAGLPHYTLPAFGAFNDWQLDSYMLNNI